MATLRLVDLLQHSEQIDAIEPGAIPAMLGELEVIRARLWAQLLRRQADRDGGGEKPQESDHLLTPADAASLLDVTVTWLYRHHKQLPFTRRISRKVLRFSEVGLRRWLAHRARP